jgi:hypothetical protein
MDYLKLPLEELLYLRLGQFFDQLGSSAGDRAQLGPARHRGRVFGPRPKHRLAQGKAAQGSGEGARPQRRPVVKTSWPLCAALLLLPTLAVALNGGLGPAPETVRRETPLETVQGFLESAHQGNYAEAAHYLDLDSIARSQQPEKGKKLARRLRFILDRKLPVDLTSLSKEPEGDPDAPRHDQLGTIELKHSRVPIRVSRVSLSSGEPVWVFSEETVRGIEPLWDEYGPPFGDTLPEVFLVHSFGTLELWQWLGLVAVLLGALIGAWLFQKLAVAAGARMAKLTAAGWDDRLVQAARGPLFLPAFCMALAIGSAALLLSQEVQRAVDVLVKSLLIFSVAWYLLRALKIGAEYVESRTTPDLIDVRSRQLRTQIAVLKRIGDIAIWVVALALFLMQFTLVRNVGVSLLASAGLAGLVIGLAAQRSLGSILAGVQLSMTQPVRIGDTVVIASPTWWFASGTCAAWWCRSPTSSRSRSRTGPAEPPRCSAPSPSRWTSRPTSTLFAAR